MKQVIETSRLILREFQPSDAESMFLLNSDPEVIRYTGDPPFKDIQDAEDFLKNYSHYAKNGFGRWPVIDKTNNLFVGWCGLKRHENEMIDLGFRFFKKDWGKGYATESAKVCLDYGIQTLQLPEIVGRAAKANSASVRVLEKIGMTYWKDAPCDGIQDSVYYRITSTS